MSWASFPPTPPKTTTTTCTGFRSGPHELGFRGHLLLGGAGVHVRPQSRDTFLLGLGLYEARPDKDYSLTDCISMETMRARGLTDALTADHHFAQEGFTILFEGEP